jgi:hypothetical protein
MVYFCCIRGKVVTFVPCFEDGGRVDSSTLSESLVFPAAMVAAVSSEESRTATSGGGELVVLDAADLAWNRSDERFWFHYTDRDAALAIATGGIYEVGDQHPKAPGLYVTTVQPGALGSEELLNALFDGTRDIERTQATVVIADGAVTFERVSEHAWRYSAPVNTELDLADQIVGWAVFERDMWMYSPGVYLPIRSQLGP